MTVRVPPLHELRPLKVTFGVLWRVGVLGSFIWVIGDALDGGGLLDLIAVPLLVIAWAWSIVILDRWVGGHI
jgi:hypothetical protein